MACVREGSVVARAAPRRSCETVDGVESAWVRSRPVKVRGEQGGTEKERHDTANVKNETLKPTVTRHHARGRELSGPE